MLKIRLFLPIVIFPSILVGCQQQSSLCENKIINSITSPQNNYTAYKFIRDCGATTKASYQLSILNSGQEFGNQIGNVFVSYGPFDVQWVNPKEIVIKYDNSSEVFKKENKYKDITIQYVER